MRLICKPSNGGGVTDRHPSPSGNRAKQYTNNNTIYSYICFTDRAIYQRAGKIEAAFEAGAD